MQPVFASSTHVGRRANNEDDCCTVSSLGLFAVADGMGGYEGGEIASRSTIVSMIEFFQRVQREPELAHRFGHKPSRPPAASEVAAAIRFADLRIRSQRHGALARMGSTVAMMKLDGDTAIIGHVGDSRVYRLRSRQLEQLTMDHSYYEALAAACGGALPPRRQFGFANVITRALGTDMARPDLRVERVAPGDTFLICTDGIHDVIDDDVIADLLTARDVEQACAGIVATAYHHGGTDNITAVVVRAVEAKSTMVLLRP